MKTSPVEKSYTAYGGVHVLPLLPSALACNLHVQSRAVQLGLQGAA